jgi:hypothetical protein
LKTKKKPPILSGVLEFFGSREMGLHSHTYYANTHLFKNFIANFIAESPQIESKQKDDFIEEWG